MRNSQLLQAVTVTIAWAMSTAAPAADVPAPASVHHDSLAVAREAIKAERWLDAIKLLENAAQKNPVSADVFNLLGYSHRRAGILDKAFSHYKTALSLEPDHKGAHEYIGEAYLLAGDMKQALVHLRALERLCPAGCEAREDLQRAVTAAQAKR